MSDELVRFALGEGSAGVYVELAEDDSGVEPGWSRATRRPWGHPAPRPLCLGTMLTDNSSR
ncbi:hypothetical protein ABT186_30865 [Streptomyces sp. NPDC001634]|uniref:hypothetical protein n=1 Tax=Streptomyces sp. NPDC001634 TaxID=3154390 RepID=UPI00332F455F